MMGGKTAVQRQEVLDQIASADFEAGLQVWLDYVKMPTFQLHLIGRKLFNLHLRFDFA